MASSRTQLEMYLERVARVNASSSRSVPGYASASNAELAGSNPPRSCVRFWFTKVASSNRTWVVLVFETHNFGTGCTNDAWQLHVVVSSNLVLMRLVFETHKFRTNRADDLRGLHVPTSSASDEAHLGCATRVQVRVGTSLFFLENPSSILV